MYLLFAVASVASTTALGADVFLTLTHYIRDVKDTPHHIEELVAELASALVLLDHFKTLIEERHSSALETIADWAEESRVLLASCKQTFEQIQSEVERTLKEEKSNVGQKVIGAAGKEETQRLKGALDKHQQSIRLMMATIISHQVDNIDQTTTTIHDLNQETQDGNPLIQEKLMATDEKDSGFQSVDGTVHVNSPPQSAEATGATPDFALIHLLDTRCWNPASIQLGVFAGPTEFNICLEASTMRLTFTNGNIACVEILLDSRDQTAIKDTRRKLRMQERRNREEAETTDNSISNYEQDWHEATLLGKALFVASAVCAVTCVMQSGRALPPPPRWARTAAYGTRRRTPFAAVPILTACTILITSIAVMGWRNDAERQRRKILAQLDSDIDRKPAAMFWDTYRTGKVRYPVAFLRVTRCDPQTVQLEPGPYTHPARAIQGSMAMKLTSTFQADEVEALLCRMIKASTTAWESHSLAFAGFDPHTVSCGLRSSAVREEFRWSVLGDLQSHHQGGISHL